MLALMSKAVPSILRIRQQSPHIGRLLIPNEHSGITGMLESDMPWAADNGAFGHFDYKRFMSMMEKIRDKPGCRFVAAPDVVADGAATMLAYMEWEPILRRYGLPLALVGQDGMERMLMPWNKMDALFIGGSTEWKLGKEAADLVAEAKRRGKWVHMGRVNSYKRTWYAASIGCDSVDGSGMSRFEKHTLPRVIRALREINVIDSLTA